MADLDLLAELARFIERIAAIARTGLAFKPDGFDSERYEELLKEAARMHSVVAGATADDAEALRRRWLEQVVAGYEALMPPFKDQITEVDLLKIIAYIKSIGKEGATR